MAITMKNKNPEKDIRIAFSSTKEYIERLKNDKAFYNKMVEKESEAWKGSANLDERRRILKEEQIATFQLGAFKQKLKFLKDVIPLKETYNNILSLGCGTGRLEYQLIKDPRINAIHGIDVSEQATYTADKIAKKENLNLTYEAQDLNFPSFRKTQYDLVITQTCLHHILNLEELCDEIYSSLKPGGILWIHDFIGESQFQWDDKRLAIVNNLLDELPEKFKFNHLNKKPTSLLKRNQPGRIGSPFESIRSEEIKPIFLNQFKVIKSCEFDTIIRFVSPMGTRQNYITDENSKFIFYQLLMLDSILLDNKILKPCSGQYILQKV